LRRGAAHAPTRKPIRLAERAALDTSDAHTAEQSRVEASYGLDVDALAPGASNFYDLTGKFPSGSTAVVIVNPFNTAWESDYTNDVALFTAQ